MGATQIKGVDSLLAKLKGELRTKKAKNFSIAIRECGIDLIGKSLQLVPVWQGPLRASGDVRVEGTGFDTVVHAGYTAEYALIVHEVLPPDSTHGSMFNTKHADKIARARKYRKAKKQKGGHKYWFNRGAQQRAKFLEEPFRFNRDAYLDHIKEELAK